MRPQYERVPVDQLKFDPKNSRKHDTKNIKAIKESLLKFGQQKPIVVMADGTVIAGNGTLQAFKELLKETGQQEMWSTIDVHWSALKKSEAKAYGLADNRSAELAMWDDSQLKESLEELSAEGWDLGDLGWDDKDLESVLDSEQGTEGLTDEDAVPEVEQNVFGVKLGDIWQLGNHRLMCGDSTDRETVEKLMNGEKADMVFTDPPYGVSAVSKGGTVGGGNICKPGVYKQIIGDDTTDTAEAVYKLCVGLEIPTLILWGGNYYSKFCPPTACWIVWDKRGDMASNNFADCELAWTNLGSPARIYKQVWAGMIKEGETGKRVHPTQKPIALAEWCFESYGKPKSVLDLFLGSGSTLIACEKTGRKCYGMELDPHYCSVIIKRWQDFTGKTANLVTR